MIANVTAILYGKICCVVTLREPDRNAHSVSCCTVLHIRLHAHTIAVSPHRKNLAVKFMMPFEETGVLPNLQGLRFHLHGHSFSILGSEREIDVSAEQNPLNDMMW